METISIEEAIEMMVLDVVEIVSGALRSEAVASCCLDNEEDVIRILNEVKIHARRAMQLETTTTELTQEEPE